MREPAVEGEPVDPRFKRLEDLKAQIAELHSTIGDAESRRKALMQVYLKGQRKLRARNKELLDHARAELLKYQLRYGELQVEAAQLEADLGLASIEKAREAIAALNRLRSTLPHEDWLIWTRSIWKFKETESTAKTGTHPAQFSAILPHRLIKMFSFIGDTVLDPFMGMGTTLQEAWLLERHSIGIDINPKFVEADRLRVERQFAPEGSLFMRSLLADYKPIIHQGDARNLSMIPDESVQLIVTHPPYWNAVKISKLEDDLSICDNSSYEWFLGEMEKVFREMARVLEEERVCCVVTGDVLRKVDGVTQLFPLHADYYNIARRTGFTVWDTYIWETKIRDSQGRPMMGSYPYPHKIFSQFAHNYILVFRKSKQNERRRRTPPRRRGPTW
jgi:DNA modification methylase